MSECELMQSTGIVDKNGVAFDDDAQIVTSNKMKDYGDDDVIFISIEELEEME